MSTVQRAETEPAETDLVAPIAGWGVGVVGLLLVGVGVVYWAVRDVALFDFVVATLPAAATVGGWLAVRQIGYDPEFYPRLFGWTAASAATLVGLIVFALLVQGGSMVDAIPLVQFVGGIGSTAGLLIGVNEIRSVRNARRAERARVKADLLDRERERLEFLNGLLRHNVLNSVQVVQAYSELVREETEADVSAELDTIQAENEDIVELIENVRILVRAATEENGTRPVALTELLCEEIDEFASAHPDATVECEVSDDLTVRADGLVRYVFENLLRNAIEHNDTDHPTVRVTAEAVDQRVRVEVADDGPGVPDVDKPHVFDPEEAGNHGLGLYLADRLVTDYGGEIRVTDNDPRGAVFVVTLPRAS